MFPKQTTVIIYYCEFNWWVIKIMCMILMCSFWSGCIYHHHYRVRITKCIESRWSQGNPFGFRSVDKHSLRDDSSSLRRFDPEFLASYQLMSCVGHADVRLHMTSFSRKQWSSEGGQLGKEEGFLKRPMMNLDAGLILEFWSIVDPLFYPRSDSNVARSATYVRT